MAGIISQFGVEAGHQGNRTGNNGQIQLWQFLLEILTDREHRTIISWLGMYFSEFKNQNILSNAFLEYHVDCLTDRRRKGTLTDGTT